MKKSLLWIVLLILSLSMFTAFSEVALAEEAPLPSGDLMIWCWSPNDVDLDSGLTKIIKNLTSLFLYDKLIIEYYAN